jgi:trans-2,3-dihydro-3-hydroxyanthranilate isomerase
VPDARGLTDEQMQRLAAEFNYSESSFVFPPDDPRHTAKVRIFNRTHEMAFAGHPNVGTAFVLARLRPELPAVLQFEEKAGLVEVTVERDAEGTVLGASVNAPQALTTGAILPPDRIAACLGIDSFDIETGIHPPMVASVGMPFVVAEVAGPALSPASPRMEAFQQLVDQHGELAGRLSLFFYAPAGEGRIRARMFAPLAGTWEDAATGSASAALVALLLARSGAAQRTVDILQGVEMGRPSRIGARAWREGGDIRAAVRGEAVMMFKGEILL